MIYQSKRSIKYLIRKNIYSEFWKVYEARRDLAEFHFVYEI